MSLGVPYFAGTSGARHPDEWAPQRLLRCTQPPEYDLKGCFCCTQIPEFTELLVLKSRTEANARKKDGVIFVEGIH
jgi:hypothetical protein